ncbi:MAG TPA: endo-1,4-beta-xylanase [Steroidobacteraceae bacterium]|nr:endo-1,4-beta-xylanase [Steroidobacteraceae bacterium]
MKKSAYALARACLLLSVAGSAIAQTAPVIVEAESGALGSSLTTATAGSVTYITTTENAAVNPTPSRTATYNVTFPAAGTYELYVRILTGPNSGNDDSFYVGNGFNTSTNWSAAYNTSTGGFTNPNDTVLTGGGAGQNVYKWVKLTGADGIGPAGWVVPAGALTQSFSWGSREDGLNFDKFAFGVAGVCYKLSDLDAGTNATGTCPPPPPPDPPPYTRTDPAIATGNAKYLGAAWSPGTASLNFANYWNQITPENGGKWGTVEATRDVMNWAQADESYALAKARGFKFKWHTMVWGSQQPAWLNALSPAEQLEEIQEWYAAVAARYPDIDQMDVVNEPLHAPPPYINALGGAGATGWDWIIKSFEMARQYFPHTQLLINDYSITNDGNATTRYLQIVNLLKDRGLIDGIGDQVHAFSTTEAAPMPNHRANLDRLAATGLPIYGSEFDLDGVAFGVINNEVQVANYQRVFPVFWEHPSVKGITIWGYVRGFHWRNSQGDWLLYPNGGERPALQWLIRYVQNLPATVTAGQKFSVSETAAGGTAIGNVLATDPDAGTVFSQWQLTDPSGKFAIDPVTGTLSLKADATLDFETTTAYTVQVSVWDGYNRSAAASVAIKVTNENDSAPAITAGQAFSITDGYKQIIAEIEVSDPDDINQIGFTKFKNFKIVSGDPGKVFKLRKDGELEVFAKEIDWSKSGYTLGATVGDGVNTSAVETISISIPNQVELCVDDVVQVTVPKAQAAKIVAAGADLGKCKYWE